MANVDIPGVGVVEFPDTMTQAEIAAAIRKMPGMAPRSEASPLAAGAVALGERVLDNMSGIANLPFRAVNAAADMLTAPVGNGPNPIRPGSPLARLEQAIPRWPTLPSGEEFAAAIGTPAQALFTGQSLADAYAGNMAQRRQMAADNPMSDTLGQFGGDAVSLLLGRVPLGNAARGASMTGRAGAASDDIARLAAPTSTGLFDRAIAGAINKGVNAWSGPKSTALTRTLAQIPDSAIVRKLAQGAARSLETGLEGAALALAQERDPLEVAGFAAGGQAASSLISEAFEDVTSAAVGGGSVRSRAINLGIAALASATAWQLLQSALPGGEDNPLASVEGAFNKVALGIGLGVASELVGRRASGQGFLREFPALADALQTVPRTTLVQAGMAISGDPLVKRAAQNAHALGASDAKLYTEALLSSDPSRSIRDLLDSNPRIRRILTAPDPRLANVPEKSDG